MEQQWRRLVQLWEAAQVELHGKYSTERVIELSKYAREKSWLHVFTVLIVTPLPCLLVTVLVDILPLADPSEGVKANTVFFVRYHIITLVLTFICIHQFRISIPILSYPIWRAFMNSVWISALSVCVVYSFTLVVGFPVPFTLIGVTPAWLTFIAISMAVEWMKQISNTPGAKVMMMNVLKVWMCQVTLEFVYPPYYFVFTTLSDRSQMVFALLLPVIKLAMRNVFVRTVVHLKNELPEIVIFNVEVFNALFVSYCMQNSPSIWTTLELMLVDIVMIALSVRDMESTRRGLSSLEERIDRDKNWRSYISSIGDNTARRGHFTLERVRILMEEQAKAGSKSRLELQRVPNIESTVVSPKITKTGRNKVEKTFFAALKSFQNEVRPASLTSTTTKEPPKRVKVAPALDVAGKSLQKSSVKVQYIRKVQRLLYMAEFLLLLNYVEVIIPLVFSIYMVATYQLPNRQYYAQLHGMTQSDLVQTLENVMFYCSLQIVSLALLVFVLQMKLGLSPVHQLAFVLEKQFSGVQTRLVFWVFYNVQASLQHNGYDYTFQFPWLKTAGTQPS